MMRTRHGRWLALAAVLTLGACTSAREADAPAPACPSVERLGRDGTERRTDPERHRGSAFPIEVFADISEDPVSEEGGGGFQAILTDMAAFNGAGMSATVMTAAARGAGRRFGGRRSRRSGRQPVRHREHHQVGDRRSGDADGRGRRALARRPGLRLPPGELRLRHQRSDDPPAARDVRRHP